jgi:NADH-quinone oxidoreductase subunit J
VTSSARTHRARRSARGIGDILFAGIALLTVVSAAWVAFSRNIVHSAFALLGTFFGVAGLYVFLSADFLAVVQALVYVGGILVLILFAVMLTGKIGDVKVSNRSAGVLPGLLLLVLLLGLLGALVLATPWQVAGPA